MFKAGFVKMFESLAERPQKYKDHLLQRNKSHRLPWSFTRLFSFWKIEYFMIIQAYLEREVNRFLKIQTLHVFVFLSSVNFNFI